MFLFCTDLFILNSLVDSICHVSCKSKNQINFIWFMHIEDNLLIEIRLAWMAPVAQLPLLSLNTSFRNSLVSAARNSWNFHINQRTRWGWWKFVGGVFGVGCGQHYARARRFGNKTIISLFLRLVGTTSRADILWLIAAEHNWIRYWWLSMRRRLRIMCIRTSEFAHSLGNVCITPSEIIIKTAAGFCLNAHFIS